MRAICVALMAVVGGCTPISDGFRCQGSNQCVREGVAGTCESDGWCSFPDAACGSGRRYGEFAGDGRGGACVTPRARRAARRRRAAAVTRAGRRACCVSAIALGDGHGCALVRVGGGVVCWGKNDHGQLGNGGGGDAAAAVAVVDDHGVPIAGVTALAAGAAHTCALRGDRTVVCWGDDGSGQLGRGAALPGPSVNALPAPVGLTSIVAIAAGARHTCAALADGAVWCWGANEAAELGPAAPAAGTSMPAEVVDSAGLPLMAGGLGAGATQSYAVGKDARARLAWGSNANGELGDGTMAATSGVTVAAALGAHVTAAAGGAGFGCALGDDGRVSCFGADDRGQASGAAGATVAVPTAVARRGPGDGGGGGGRAGVRAARRERPRLLGRRRRRERRGDDGARGRGHDCRRRERRLQRAPRRCRLCRLRDPRVACPCLWRPLALPRPSPQLVPQPSSSPMRAAGCSDASSTASSQPAASMMTMPPTSSLVSMKGPSVTASLPLLRRSVLAAVEAAAADDAPLRRIRRRGGALVAERAHLVAVSRFSSPRSVRQQQKFLMSSTGTTNDAGRFRQLCAQKNVLASGRVERHNLAAMANEFEGIGYTRSRDGFPLEAIVVPVPLPGDDRVLVHVVASSLNPLDYKLAQLKFFGRTPPVVLGFNLAGVVDGRRPGGARHRRR